MAIAAKMNNNHLQNSGIFSNLTPEQISDIAPFFHLLGFHAGQSIYQQGEPSENLHLLAEGEVMIIYANAGETVNLFRLRPGDFFGEAGILRANQIHRTRALAVTDVEVLTLSANNFNKLKTHYPRIALEITENISRALSVRVEEDTIRLGNLAQLASLINNNSAGDNQSSLGDNVLQSIAKAIPCHRAFLGITNKSRPHCLNITSSIGLDAKELPREIEIDTDPYLTRLYKKSPEILLDKNRYATADKVTYAKHQLLGQTLRFDGNNLGVIILADKIDGQFADAHSLLLSIIASKLAIALAQADSHNSIGDLRELKREYIGF